VNGAVIRHQRPPPACIIRGAPCHLGNVLHDLGRKDQALEHYRQAAALRPTYAAAFNNLGLALSEAGRHAEAAVTLKHVIRLDPQVKEGFNYLGLALADLGRFAEAEAAYEAALALGAAAWVAVSAVSDWRWLVGREDTPWYPTLHLFRQRRLHDWDDVFARMAGQLRRLVAGGDGLRKPPGS
jgi:superkiller protein 3